MQQQSRTRCQTAESTTPRTPDATLVIGDSGGLYVTDPVMEGPVLMPDERFRDAVFVFGEPVGETAIYPSLAVAAKALEPWQLDDTFAVDARGHRVILQRRGPRVIAEATNEMHDPAQLRQRAEDELRAAGIVPALKTGPLDLLHQLTGVLGYAR